MWDESRILLLFRDALFLVQQVEASLYYVVEVMHVSFGCILFKCTLTYDIGTFVDFPNPPDNRLVMGTVVTYYVGEKK